MSTPRHVSRDASKDHRAPPGQVASETALAASPSGDLAGRLLHLQRTVGNQAVNALLRQSAVQRAARPLTAMSLPLQRQEEENEPVQTSRASVVAQRQEDDEDMVQPTRAAGTGPEIHRQEDARLGSHVRTAGNAVVQRYLWTSKEFKKNTPAGFNLLRGETLEQIEKLLDEYHGIVDKALHLQPGPKMDRYEQILTELVQNTNHWITSHQGDTSSSGNRRDGIDRLKMAATKELAEAQATRKGFKDNSIAIEDFKPRENKFITKMQGDASSFLEKLGSAISKAIPQPGDSVEADVDVQIPYEPTGVGYVGFGVHAEAKREDDRATMVRFEVKVISGFKVSGIADIGGELGFFIQAQGADPEQAMKLISYAWYRRFREAKALPREIANLMWGGSLEDVGWNRSEQWAANVEKEAFSREKDDKELTTGVGSAATTNEFVRTGLVAGVSAEGGVGGAATLSGSAGINVGTHYDQKSVTAGKQKKQGKLGMPMPVPSRGTTDKLGTSFMTVDAAMGAAFGPFEGELSASLELMFRKAEEGKGNEGYLSASLSATAPLVVDATLNETLFKAIKELVPQASRVTHVLESKAASSKETRGAATKAVQDVDAGLAPALSSLTIQDLGDKFGATGTKAVPSSKHAGDEYNPTLAADQLMSGAGVPSTKEFTIEFNAGYQFGEGKDGWTFDIQVSQATGVELSASVAGLSMTKSSRLLRLIWKREEKKWKTDEKEWKFNWD
jgi:hypothetical protein